MLVEKISSSGDLLHVQVAAPRKMNSAPLEVGLDVRRVAPPFIQVLNIGEGRAARTAYQQDRLLFVEKLFSLAPLDGQAEVPRKTILIARGQIKGGSRQDA